MYLAKFYHKVNRYSDVIFAIQVKKDFGRRDIFKSRGERMQNMDKVNGVTRMQEYIEAHLQETITLYQLAAVSGYSPYHASRIFKELLGKTPFEYIRALRLSRAALVLRDQQVRVLDVALEFVFDSHEGFTRAFTKNFGISPYRYSQNPQPIQLFMPHRIREYYLMIQRGDGKMSDKKEIIAVFTQVIERPKRKLILKRGQEATDYFKYCEEVGCDIWGVLTSIKEALYEPVGMWLPEKMILPNTSKYIQGVEVPLNYSGELPEGFEIIELEPCLMMVFQGPPHDDEAFMDAIEDVWAAMKRYDPKIYGYEWADDEVPRFQLIPLGERGYIEARGVRKIEG